MPYASGCAIPCVYARRFGVKYVDGVLLRELNIGIKEVVVHVDSISFIMFLVRFDW